MRHHTRVPLVDRLIGPAGEETGRHRFELGPGRRLSRTLAELMPSTDGQITGHIVVDSTRPIGAQQLFGDFGLTFLSAVPPTLIE